MTRRLKVIAWMMLFAVGARAADSTAVQTNSLSATSSDIVNHFAAGVILGEPTGLSVKYWLNETLAIDGALGVSFNHDNDNDGSFYLHSDVLWHNFDLLKVSQGRLPVYFGVGGLLRFRDNNEDNQFGIRVPVGLSYLFDDAPVEIFAEVGPALDLTPAVQGEITGGVGVRFRF